MSTVKKPATAATVSAVATAEEATKHIEQVVTAGKETIEAAVKASSDVASKGYEKAVAISKDQVEAAVKAQNVAFKSYEDAVSFGKENIDAVVRAGSILTRGMQDLGKTVMGLSQEAFEETVAVSKQMMGAKSLKEAIDLHSDLARTGLDKVVTQGTKLSDSTVKLIEEAFAPITERVTATVEKLTKAA